jgi:hypothetical protein
MGGGGLENNKIGRREDAMMDRPRGEHPANFEI